ncbi:MAG: DUF2950 family protein [Bryobacteraceae bacterium]
MKTFTVMIGTLIIWLPATLFGQAPKTFDSAEAAAQALIVAAEKDDVAGLAAIFGPAGKSVLTSGDAEQDKKERAEFARLARDQHQLEPDEMNSAVTILSVGSENWPFPVPIVSSKDKWSFDAPQGAVEMRARRIGANELDAIEICSGYVAAQMEYAAQDRDNHKILAYAQHIVSAKGLHDGLYWEGNSESLVPKGFADAAVEAGRTASATRKPYQGYYFRVLKAQGPNAEGGQHNYVVKDWMIGGFGLVAFPAHYGVSGIHTFIVNHDGAIYEKDLGAPATSASTTVTGYDPDKSWTRVE